MITRACADCPFLKESSYLHPDRAREIGENALSWDGMIFWCHKTAYSDGEHTRTTNGQHCAGSTIFSEKHGVATQAMRIAGRLRLYDPDQMRGHELVYDSLEDMVDGHLVDRTARNRKTAAGGGDEESASKRSPDSNP